MKKRKMNYKRIIRSVVFCLGILIAFLDARAQEALSQPPTTPAEVIRNEMISINKVYDSAFFLTFDVNILHYTDTLWPGTDSAEYTRNELKGTYTFHDKKAIYKLGELEYMQNDSFTIALYKDDKMMLVGKPGIQKGAGSFIPNRDMLDSMMVYFGQQYSYALYDEDSVRRIAFTALDSNATYQRISITYDSLNYQLLEIAYKIKQYDYVDTDPEDPENPGNPILRNVDMVMHFEHYRVEAVGADVFSETKYLFFDGPDEIQPATAYKDYTIYKSY